MSADQVLPCRHPGAMPDEIVSKVINVISSLSSDKAFLADQGLSQQEYEHALPAAIERLRGRYSADTKIKRKFLHNIFQHMLGLGIISKFEMPRHGKDTVYRLTIESLGDVAIIQKGCPDGAHSSVRWQAPDWAVETYIWWLCSSQAYEPGEHVAKGVNRLRNRFFSQASDNLDGVIFHNELCGTTERPCPKKNASIIIEGASVPPPCIFVMPAPDPIASEWNWRGETKRKFPNILLSMFSIPLEQADSYVGYVGFQQRGSLIQTTISSIYGPGRSTKFRK